MAGPWADFEHAGIAKLKSDSAHEVYTTSAAQLAEWRKAAEHWREFQRGYSRSAPPGQLLLARYKEGLARREVNRRDAGEWSCGRVGYLLRRGR